MLLGGCHAGDALRYLSGREVAEVTAYANNVKGAFEYDANVVAVLRFADGTILRSRLGPTPSFSPGAGVEVSVADVRAFPAATG